MKIYQDSILTVENLTEDICIDILLPKNATEIKQILRKLDSSENTQYRVKFIRWNGTYVETFDYFQELSTMEEIIKGLEEFEKDIENLKKTSHYDLCKFMFSNVEGEDIVQLIKGKLNYDEYIMNEMSLEDVCNGLLMEQKKELVECSFGFGWYIEESTNNSEVIKCIFDNTDFSLKEIIEKIQKEDKENGTN